MKGHLAKFWLALRRILAAPGQAVNRFRKHRADKAHAKRYVARLELKPGVTNLVLMREGVPVLDLLLSQWSVDFTTGARAEFVSRYHFMRDRTMT